MPVKVYAEPRGFKAVNQRQVSSLTVSNKSVWFGLQDGRILRYTCPSSSTQDSRSTHTSAECVTLRPKAQGAASEVQRLFVDTKSFHCIACLASGHHWYSNFQSPDLVSLTSLNGCFVRSACFTEATSEDFTGSFLLGTQRGSLLEGRINYRQASFAFRTQYKLPDGEPVLDIGIIPVVYRGGRCHVLVASSTRCLYEFFGGTSFDDTFSKYSKTGANALRYEVPLAGPIGDIIVSERSDGSHDLFWANATGIVFVNVPYRVADDASSCLKFPPSVITYIMTPQHPLSSLQETKLRHVRTFLRRPAIQVPRSVVVVRDSLLLLYDDTIGVVNTIVGKQVGTLPLPHGAFGKVHWLLRDRLTGEVWLHATEGMFEVSVSAESEDAWKHYLFKGDIANALSSCKTSGQRDNVLLKSAYDLYERGKYLESARMYGQVEASYPNFENICLNFLKKHQEEAVVEYITMKLQQRNWYRYNPRFIILTVWIIEMLGYRYRDVFLTLQASRGVSGIDTGALATRCEEYRRKLFSTIGSLAHIDELAPSINFLLQTVMGCGDECVDFARIRRDSSNVVYYMINSGNVEGALRELIKMPPSDKRDALVLRFAPLMFMDAPALFEQASFSKLDPVILLPIALLPLMMRNERYLRHSLGMVERLLFSNETAHEESKRSLLWCCYILLLANLETEEPLLEVLNKNLVDFRHIDLAIALRYLKVKSSTDSRWSVPFIVLQSLCGMNEDALEMALSQNNMELAKQCAMRPSDEFTRCRLWRYILLQSSRNGEASLGSIIDTSNGLLQVHDLLHLLPEDTKLGDLSSIISRSVAEYESDLEERRQEVDHLCACIAETKSEIEMASRRCVSLPVDRNCMSCSHPLHTGHFIVFPCAHAFHRSCVATTLRSLLSGADLLELKRLHREFERRVDERSVSAYNEYLSRACVICGYPAALLASKPFIASVNAVQEDLWAIN
ncbi:Pep3/Vps18/deep orange family protein, putative [Babesia bigemina]|uniref:Pep3/Vps18/deep orange family protein, putative n=1 Tax=Babesia bigemina TaxID=5866 RepID=A0A061D4G7_BABBI|nr:Pep3/Vps18/deep orange family protein, putative [Babesia bigemina]CDR93824.1 Pep3/Vps18/deep orange family protein, putative [Babesia bigemina]|eukprot:XP_012766010.1 Pep3/Vps18/deep orange family protein, putative [Babesia bigemina]